MSRLITILFVLAVGWGVYYLWSGGTLPRLIFPRSGQSTPTIVSVPQSLTPSTPAATGPPNSAPPSAISPAELAPIQAELADARDTVAQKTALLQHARQATLGELAKNAEYQSAEAHVASLLEQVKEARVSKSEQLADLSNQWLAAKSDLAKRQEAAIKASPAVQAVLADLDDARHHVEMLRAKMKSASGVPHN